MLGRVAPALRCTGANQHLTSSVKLLSSHATVRSSYNYTSSLRLFSSLHHARPRPASFTHSSSILPCRYFSSTSNMAKSTRTETDAFGPLQVESDKYWGAQTQRSLGNFNIHQPQDRMPDGVVRAFGILKGAAAKVNMRYGLGTAKNNPPSSYTPPLINNQTPRLVRPFNKLPPKSHPSN